MRKKRGKMWLMAKGCMFSIREVIKGRKQNHQVMFVPISLHTFKMHFTGPYLGKFDWGGGCVPCGRRPQRGEVCGRGMCPLLHRVRKLKYTSIL